MQAVIATECPYRVQPMDGVDGALPLIIEPIDDPDPGRLSSWLTDNESWVQNRLTEYGALLFRGFAVEGAADFEGVARSVDADLKKEYLGTSPRDALSEYVFSASELPGYYPIPQHCEMSFIKHPPRRVFFCCLTEPAEASGETPLVDFRRVVQDLDPDVLNRFVERGLRIVRNYAGPDKRGVDLWQLKGWHEMFLTRDRAAVEARCKEEGFEVQWTDGDGLRLVHEQPATRNHPVTGEVVWYNHLTTFHLSAAPGEYRHIFKLRPSAKHWALWQFSRGMVALKQLKGRSDEHAMHVTHADGSEIPDADVEAVRDAVWRHMVISPWRRRDVLAIDNHSVSHGRLPYASEREIAVCWA
ncbi:MAG: TauD/TfdA family dioxygenase [Myxococcales bacterium]|nr:TauD/TfdA family dioxygenase [Myxococcales bacterium]